jgi:hypothetical protein
VAWKNIVEDIAGGQTSSAAEDGRPFAEGLEQDLKNLVVAANVVIALNEGACVNQLHTRWSVWELNFRDTQQQTNGVSACCRACAIVWRA